MQARNTTAGSGTSQPAYVARPASALLVGVAVNVPEYLDRLDIVERTSANEIRPNYGAQWGENLELTATRALVGNLATLLPSDEIIAQPSRGTREIDYQVTLQLTKFESTTDGNSVLEGRWSILDGAGTERAAGRELRSEQATPGDYPSMAAAMSRNLAAVSADIARAVERLPSADARNKVDDQRKRGTPSQRGK